jgi:hydrogenase maturation factor
MCLTVPLKIKQVKGQTARLSDGREVNIVFTDKVKKNDWVLTNANLAVAKISDKEAKEIKNYYKK